MRTAMRIVGVVVLLLAVWLSIDYFRIQAKERRVSGLISQFGGHSGSIPAWPFGTEYRITFTRPLTSQELTQLDELNTLRGWVAVAFADCDMSNDQIRESHAKLPRCTLFRVANGEMSPLSLDNPIPNRATVSLAAAEIFHERLNKKCQQIGIAARYKGSLSLLPQGRGLSLATKMGHWQIVPASMLVEERRPLAKLVQDNSLFGLSIESDRCSEEEIYAVTVEGETITVCIQGVSKDWHIPDTDSTVGDLLRACSDD